MEAEKEGVEVSTPEYQRELKRQNIGLLKGELANAKADVDRAVAAFADHIRLDYKGDPPLAELQARFAYMLDVAERLQDQRDGFQRMPQLQSTPVEVDTTRDTQLAPLVGARPIRQVGHTRLVGLIKPAPGDYRRAPR